MRTTVIPAQITTVEDKIAGNLNFTQVLLLLASLLIDTFIYAVLPQRLHFSLYKFPFMLAATLICLILCMRIKGRVMLNWIFLLAGYYFRPRYYVFNKNDLYLRPHDLLPELKKKKALRVKKAVRKSKSQIATIPDLAGLEALLIRHRDRLSFRFNKNGGIHAIWQTK